MITKQLIKPESIAVIGASNTLSKPGGKLYYSLKNGTFGGRLYAINPKEDSIQGDECYKELSEVPDTDLAILAIPAPFCADTVEFMASKKSTRAFIIISAGFSEENEEGAQIEKRIATICDRYDASLIGPNCIGVMNPLYQGVFTLPIPKLDPAGCDFISGSGATAVFIMEAGLQKGLKFNSVFSVGNSAQIGVEDVLAYMDETYREGESSKVKILYFETIHNPDKLLKHASGLIRKGCRIAAIKAGTSEAGSRAASSHTGAMASSDQAVDSLFRKAGIVRCYGRDELATVAAVMLYDQQAGKRFAIITHAGGPAVMLTDVLSEGSLEVPDLSGKEAEALRAELYPGSSAANPIDILATGTADHVRLSLEYCEKVFSQIDSIVVIFGTPGLAPVFDVYEVIHEHMKTASKPVFPVLPSITTAAEEVNAFLAHGRVNFPDEVVLGNALVKIHSTPQPAQESIYLEGIDIQGIRRIIETSDNGFLKPEKVAALLASAGIPVAEEGYSDNPEELKTIARELGYPVVCKVVGVVHKTDVGGVELNIENEDQLMQCYYRMKEIEGFQSLMIQPMMNGTELFIGASYEAKYGHIMMCGLGGIYVESLKDISTGLAPLTFPEARDMIRRLKSYTLLKGTRGNPGIDLDKFEEIIVRLSSMLRYCKEVVELDLNPVIAGNQGFTVVDSRIRIEK